MDWITFIGIASMLVFIVAGALIVIGVVIGGTRGSDRLMEDDFPVQNDFGVSMSRFGYVQKNRNGGAL
jgi:hypothetical protein